METEDRVGAELNAAASKSASPRRKRRGSIQARNDDAGILTKAEKARRKTVMGTMQAIKRTIGSRLEEVAQGDERTAIQGLVDSAEQLLDSSRSLPNLEQALKLYESAKKRLDVALDPNTAPEPEQEAVRAPATTTALRACAHLAARMKPHQGNWFGPLMAKQN